MFLDSPGKQNLQRALRSDKGLNLQFERGLSRQFELMWQAFL